MLFLVSGVIDFARWLRDDYAARDALVVETSNLTVEEVADRLDDWIRASSGS